MQNNVMDYLNETVKNKPEKIAFANESEAFTFSQVYEMSRGIAT